MDKVIKDQLDKITQYLSKELSFTMDKVVGLKQSLKVLNMAQLKLQFSRVHTLKENANGLQKFFDNEDEIKKYFKQFMESRIAENERTLRCDVIRSVATEKLFVFLPNFPKAVISISPASQKIGMWE